MARGTIFPIAPLGPGFTARFAAPSFPAPSAPRFATALFVAPATAGIFRALGRGSFRILHVLVDRTPLLGASRAGSIPIFAPLARAPAPASTDPAPTSSPALAIVIDGIGAGSGFPFLGFRTLRLLRPGLGVRIGIRGLGAPASGGLFGCGGCLAPRTALGGPIGLRDRAEGQILGGTGCACGIFGSQKSLLGRVLAEIRRVRKRRLPGGLATEVWVARRGDPPR
jgi:hypothetical protein